MKIDANSVDSRDLFVWFHLSACLVATVAGQAGKPTNYKGLEVTPLSIERAQNVPLLDCPPGSNTQRGNARAGEEFAVVTLAFKVTPAFKETVVKRPVLTDADGKIYNTSVAIIDPGSLPEVQVLVSIPRPRRDKGRLGRNRHRDARLGSTQQIGNS